MSIFYRLELKLTQGGRTTISTMGRTGIFIGSSSEAVKRGAVKRLARWITLAGHTPVPWNKPGLFHTGGHLFSRLIEIAKEVDAAILVFSDDDKVWYRKSFVKQPRDNVFIEYGLFAGSLGMKNAIPARYGTAKIPVTLAVSFISILPQVRSTF